VAAARSLLAFLTVAAVATAAYADPAPIVYAARDASASVAPLAGGDENSYGYGGGAPRSGGPVIDVRRAGSGTVALPPPSAPEAAPAPSPSASSEATPDWLERERVGPPYQANGVWYVPTPEPGYSETGMASWYGPNFHGQRTANGEVFDETALTAAHPTLPLSSLVQVTNLENGREVIVRVTDRGPFVDSRLIDLSRAAAQVLGFEAQGRARVHVRYLGPAPRRVDADGRPVEAVPPAPAAPEAGPRVLTPAPVETAPVNTPTPTPAPSSGLFVQVGAFSDLSNAHRVRDEVASVGAASVDVRETAGRELFRVSVGPFADRGAADEAQRALSSLGYAQTILSQR
jgi:rare lipoprotein A